MPEISLRDYELEIDQLIEEARYLEAYAHLRHLIREYPRYIEAYYLMGKMLLEADQPNLAVDMFRRALNADPEHLKSRIGLGLAHEQQDNLDAAIWNLERAFELAPANADIVDELRRIYGRRDGKEPDHIPMSRAGLARLYMRGNLSGRAADELRNLLVKEPKRPDLMGALAEAYWRDGQIVQAAETCQTILDFMPYYWKANVLLGALWVGSGQEEGQIYLNRSQEVDVENKLAQELLGSASIMQPHEVIVERLVYDPDSLDVDQQAEWFKQLEAASASVGISEAVPEMTESEVRLVDITAGLESQIEIPDWLRELGPLTESPEEEGALSWMADMALGEELSGRDATQISVEPPEVEVEEVSIVSSGESESPATVPASAEAPADWLQEFVTEELDETEEEIPEWLEEITPEARPYQEAEAPADVVTEDFTADETEVEWAEAEFATAEAGFTEPEYEEILAETPDWLQDIVPPTVDVAEDSAEPVVETPTVSPEQLELMETEGVPEEAALFEPEEKFAEEEPEEVPDWLQAIPSTTAEATLIGKVDEAESLDADLDWLEELSAEMETEETRQVESFGEVEAEDEIPDWLQALAPSEAVVATPSTEEMDEEEALAWLDDISTDTDILEEEVLESEEAGEGLPDWLKALTPEETPTTTGAQATVMKMPSGEEVDSSDFDWLDEIATDLDTEKTQPLIRETIDEIAEQHAPDLTEVLPEQPGDVTEHLKELEEVIADDSSLDWLEKITFEPQHVDEDAPIPEWLRDLEPAAESRDESEPVTTTSAEEIPDWISQLQPESTEAEFTLSEEELPELLAAVDESERDTVLPWDTDQTGDQIASVIDATIAGEKETDFFGWQSFGEQISEATSPTERLSSSESISLADEEKAEILAEQPETEEPVEEASAGLIGWDAFGDTILEAQSDEAKVQGEILSGEDALAWLESLTSGKEDELRAQVKMDSDARLTEILGRRTPPAAAEPMEAVEEVGIEPIEDVAVESPVIEVQEPEATLLEAPAAEMPEPVREAEAPDEVEPESEVLSGDDALAWLESLTIGKEEELREQAEMDSEARIAEILGRRTPPAAPEPMEAVEEVGIEPIEEVAVEPSAVEVQEPEATLLEEPAEEITEPVREAEAPDEIEPETEVLSGDDALAWLESLTIGKEEELREQAEMDSEARIAEILGRHTPPAAPEPMEAVEEVGIEPIEDVAVESPAVEVQEPEATLLEAPAVEIPEPVREAEAPDGVEPETEVLSGDDALAWLESLTIGKEEELREQAEMDSEARIAEILGRRTPPAAPEPMEAVEEVGIEPIEDVAVESPAVEVQEPEATLLEEPAEEIAESVQEAEAPEIEEAVIPVFEAHVPVVDIEKRKSITEGPPAEPEPMEMEVEQPASEITEPLGEATVVSAPEIQVTPVEESPEEIVEPEALVAEPAADLEAEVETTPTTEPQSTEDSLEEMRTYLKSKRSDHAARLKFSRALFEAGNVEEAMDNYGRLIKSGAKMDELFSDLQLYLQTHPKDSHVLKTLGDAYMKEGDLERALELYNEAMNAL